MGVTVLREPEVRAMLRAGEVAAATLALVGERLAALSREGARITTADIDRWVREDTARRGGKPSQLGYQGFPATVCTSKNEVVCHGIPSARVTLSDGDIVNVDVTTEVDGFHGDTSKTFAIGTASPDALRLIAVAERCLQAGIGVVRDGARLGDIGAAIVEIASKEGVSVVREFCGHGIGRTMHAAPQVSHVGVKGLGMRLRSGMAITIEPMVNLGGPEIEILEDGWTVVTRDGSLSAQVEHTIVVLREGALITTARPAA